MNTAQLVEAAMLAAGCTSARQLAKKTGVSNVSINKWLNGDTCPTFEQACELAVLAGLPPVSTAAQVRQGSIDGAKHRVILRRLAQIAAVIVLAVGLAPHAEAATHAVGSYVHNSDAVYIMSNCKWRLHFTCTASSIVFC